jgi:hypothetical protein
MKRGLLVLSLILVGGAVASTSFAATSGTATVTLAANANAFIDVLDPSITLTPTATDYVNDYVEAAGPLGLRVRVKSNSSTGMSLLVRCGDASPQIALADLFVRTQTAAGSGGTTMGTYTAITSSNQTLWTTGVAQGPFFTVTTDVKVQNINSYTDASGGGATNYTNTLTYSVITL